MKIAIKTLQNKRLLVDVDNSDSVLEIKTRLDKDHSIGPVDRQTLIYKGTILKDEQNLLRDFTVKDTDFIIVMISKKVKTSLNAKVKSAKPEKKTTTAVQNNPNITPNVSQNSEQIIGEGNHRRSQTNNQRNEMNLQRNELRTERSEQNERGGGQVIAESRQNENEESGAGRSFDDLNNSPIEFRPLVSNNGGGEMEISSENVEILGNLGFSRDQVLRALKDTLNNPNVALEYLLAQNNVNSEGEVRLDEEMFNNFLSNIRQQYLQIQDEQGEQNAAGLPGGEAGAERMVIPLSQADQAAIQRLEGLGFDSAECLQMYIACEHNEELAANLLCEEASRRQQELSRSENALGLEGGGEEDDGDSAQENEGEMRDDENGFDGSNRSGDGAEGGGL